MAAVIAARHTFQRPTASIDIDIDVLLQFGHILFASTLRVAVRGEPGHQFRFVSTGRWRASAGTHGVVHFDPSVSQKNVRILLERHGPVEVVGELVDVHEIVEWGLLAEENVALVAASAFGRRQVLASKT